MLVMSVSEGNEFGEGNHDLVAEAGLLLAHITNHSSRRFLAVRLVRRPHADARGRGSRRATSPTTPAARRSRCRAMISATSNASESGTATDVTASRASRSSRTMTGILASGKSSTRCWASVAQSEWDGQHRGVRAGMGTQRTWTTVTCDSWNSQRQTEHVATGSRDSSLLSGTNISDAYRVRLHTRR